MSYNFLKHFLNSFQSPGFFSSDNGLLNDCTSGEGSRDLLASARGGSSPGTAELLGVNPQPEVAAHLELLSYWESTYDYDLIYLNIF